MKKFLMIHNKQCFIFESENIDSAWQHSMDALGVEAGITIQEIEGINIQHEIIFELSKKFREMVNEEAEKNGIKPKG